MCQIQMLNKVVGQHSSLSFEPPYNKLHIYIVHSNPNNIIFFSLIYDINFHLLGFPQLI